MRLEQLEQQQRLEQLGSCGNRRVRRAPRRQSLEGKKGGTLEVLQEGDFEHLDPGIAYYSVDYMVDLRHAAAAVLEQAEHGFVGEPGHGFRPAGNLL